MKTLKLLPFCLLAYLPSSFAFFCPTNFNQIDFGATTTQVTQQCGKPASQQDSTITTEKVPQQWMYYMKQQIPPGMAYQTTGSLQVSFTFDANGKAINLSVNGIGVGGTGICGGHYLQLGATQDEVKTACGSPVMVNKQNNTGIPPQQTKVTVFIYNSTPPTTLTFENGVLTKKSP